MSEHWNPAKSEFDVGDRGLFTQDVSADSLATSSRLHMTRNDCQPLTPAIYHSSTYRMNSVNQYLDILKDGGYIYSRLGNPTCESAECSINSLEGGAGTLVFNSGMAAISTAMLGLLSAGDHLVICYPIYSGVPCLVKEVLSKLGVEVTCIKTSSVEEYKKAIKKNTKVVYGEVPRNPSLDVIDLEEFGKLSQNNPNITTFVDSTFASPYLQQPIQYGVDISMHSCTKYLGGHADLLGGCLTFRTVELWKKFKVLSSILGSGLSAWEASLLIRGIKTLPIRMQKISATALRLANFLEKHPQVEKVHYPGLTSHPSHEIAKRQMRNGQCGGIMTFELKGGLEAAKTVVQGVKLIEFATSIGGAQSMVSHPATMTHGPMVMTDSDRRDMGVTDGMVRFSVGLEDPDDLERDLKQALGKL